VPGIIGAFFRRLPLNDRSLQIGAHIDTFGITTGTKMQHSGPNMLFLSLSAGLLGPGSAFSSGACLKLDLSLLHSPLPFIQHAPSTTRYISSSYVNKIGKVF
jgi:hypothetical protein